VLYNEGGVYLDSDMTFESSKWLHALVEDGLDFVTSKSAMRG
jgi:mannosyltransferase OCH1-like enzyme